MKRPDLESFAEQLRKAHDMVHALCQPRGSAGAREWIMRIPAQPDYDPDLVIGTALSAGDKIIAYCIELEAENKRLKESLESWERAEL